MLWCGRVWYGGGEPAVGHHALVVGGGDGVRLLQHTRHLGIQEHRKSIWYIYSVVGLCDCHGATVSDLPPTIVSTKPSVRPKVQQKLLSVNKTNFKLQFENN